MGGNHFVALLGGFEGYQAFAGVVRCVEGEDQGYFAVAAFAGGEGLGSFRHHTLVALSYQLAFHGVFLARNQLGILHYVYNLRFLNHGHNLVAIRFIGCGGLDFRLRILNYHGLTLVVDVSVGSHHVVTLLTGFESYQFFTGIISYINGENQGYFAVSAFTGRKLLGGIGYYGLIALSYQLTFHCVCLAGNQIVVLNNISDFRPLDGRNGIVLVLVIRCGGPDFGRRILYYHSLILIVDVGVGSYRFVTLLAGFKDYQLFAHIVCGIEGEDQNHFAVAAFAGSKGFAFAGDNGLIALSHQLTFHDIVPARNQLGVLHYVLNLGFPNYRDGLAVILVRSGGLDFGRRILYYHSLGHIIDVSVSSHCIIALLAGFESNQAIAGIIRGIKLEH